MKLDPRISLICGAIIISSYSIQWMTQMTSLMFCLLLETIMIPLMPWLLWMSWFVPLKSSQILNHIDMMAWCHSILSLLHIVCVLMTIIIQIMNKHGFLPQQFMKTMLVPILKNKNGDIARKWNYRPIAFSTVASKIYQIILVNHTEEYIVTTENKFAYKKGHYIDMCIFTSKECIRYCTVHNTPMYVCFLDASKAFDTSDTFLVWKGIKQGGILSPKLFNIYVDVLSQQLNKLMVGCCING